MKSEVLISVLHFFLAAKFSIVFSFRYRYPCILFLALYSYLNIFYTVGEKLFEIPIPDIILFTIILFVVAGIWELNRFAEAQIVSRFPSGYRFMHPLILLFLISLIVVVIVTTFAQQVLYLLLNLRPKLDVPHLKLLMALGFRVNLFLNSINAIVFFMMKLKQTQLEAEQFKKNLIEAQFEALRNQINPHFLFNCFNVLSTLVYKDADTSSLFIVQLSKVYRYLLYNTEKRIVSLDDELAFIKAYLFLLKIRFGENIIVVNEILAGHNYYIAPAVLQMLIENAIKHNVVSKKNPLSITLSIRNGYVIVSNNLQEKSVKEDSLQIGLRNIRSRYRFLTDQPVVVEKAPGFFTVEVPLLHVDE